MTRDLDGLIFSVRKGSKSGSFVVPIDLALIDTLESADRLRREADSVGAGLRGGRPMGPRAESQLTPREMQARLRAGHTVEEVAKAAGVHPEWVERFEAPVAAERSRVVETALGMTSSKARVGDSALPLAESVRVNLHDKGVAQPAELEGWSAQSLDGTRWLVRYEYVSRQRRQKAEWELDFETRSLTPRNRTATELGYVNSARRRVPLASVPRVPAAERNEIPPRPLTMALPVIDTLEPEADESEGSDDQRSSGRIVKATTRRSPAKKATARKTVAKKATARKTTARKAAAKKSPAKRAATRKVAARKAAAQKATTRKAATKSTRAAKKAVTRKSPAKKTVAKRSAARKATAARSTARKTTARKTAARRGATGTTSARRSAPKKATTRKTTAKRTTPRKATIRTVAARKATKRPTAARKVAARKAPVRKTAARKTAARKTAARKTAARKTSARKATARKTTARKVAARKAPVRKTAARKTTARKATARTRSGRPRVEETRTKATTPVEAIVETASSVVEPDPMLEPEVAATVEVQPAPEPVEPVVTTTAATTPAEAAAPTPDVVIRVPTAASGRVAPARPAPAATRTVPPGWPPLQEPGDDTAEVPAVRSGGWRRLTRPLRAR